MRQIKALEMVRDVAGRTCLMGDEEPLPTLDHDTHPLIGAAALVLALLMALAALVG
jgi:hypothetical protein